MKIFIKCLIFLILLNHGIIFDSTNVAKPVVKIHSMRIWVAPESTRIVFDLSEVPIYTINKISSNKLVVTFKAVELNAKLKQDLINKPPQGNITKIITTQDQNNIKVIFQLDEKIEFNSFLLKPTQQYTYRLVVDLSSVEKQMILSWFDLEQEKLKTAVTNKILPDPRASLIKPFVIAIDAGHGGDDPGAIGPRGTLEKDIVLNIAKKLQSQINQFSHMQAVLIRTGDYYVGLQERMLRARSHRADLFLSIHADAFNNIKATGASIFVLSEKGASSAAAQWLADSQNQSDLIGGIRIKSQYEPVVASMLLDLSQRSNYIASLTAANSILHAIGKITTLHRTKVEHAGFAVLKAPDVPSVLIETGFISNPKMELKLKDHRYQNLLVKSIVQGVKNYITTVQGNNQINQS